ncbi:SulP family inorganic anion transporter [Paenibacillus koleovorans]|uniref:SulP family inorganic anion transporter n=1 Tax=Paenibacillus koleovorans TaxID=121608 RepID=UPI000FD99FC7|nr:solute carrier family 23 protein [Paenibacillus koleovorans]
MRSWGRFTGYNVQLLRRDLVAGLIVGIVAIPLAMSFAIASGVKPQFGIYTTIVAGILIALLGGSRFQIGGPTGAFVPILLGVVLQYGYEKLLLAGMLAGILLVLMGLLKLGSLIQFIPRPVTIGFTAGIAVLIFSGQLAGFLGLREVSSHASFLANMREIVVHLTTWNGYSLITALLCLAVLIGLPKLLPAIPASLVGLVVSTAAAALFFRGKTPTIGSSYGEIPNMLPTIALPTITPELIMQLLPAALVIAMLGGIESLLSAVVADGMTSTRHNSNRELVGQGIANIVTPLFGGIPATGAIARTATNIKSGAATPLSGIVHGIVVLLVLLIFAPFASEIPLAGMAPILMVVAWNMSERKHFLHLLKARTSDSIVLLATFALTVLVSLTTAVLTGLVLSLLFLVRQLKTGTKIQAATASSVHIFTIEGPLFFATAQHLERTISDTLRMKPNKVLVRMEHVPFIDASGEHMLASLTRTVLLAGGNVMMSGLQRQPSEYIRLTALDRLIGEGNIYDHFEDALRAATLDSFEEKELPSGT